MKKSIFFSLLILLTGSTVIFSSCSKNDEGMATRLTLYDSLGGTTLVKDPTSSTVMIEQGRLGIRSVVDSTIFVIAADPKLNGFFKVLLAEVTAGNTSGFAELSKNLTDLFCAATGSKNFTYAGDDMVTAHDPAKNPRMNGKAATTDFDQFITDLVAGAKKNKLPDNLIGSVGAIVNTLRGQVVQK